MSVSTIALIVFGSGGLVGAIQLLVPWLQNRSTARVLANANATVTFWKSWLEANAAADLSTEQSAAVKQRAIDELENLSQAWDELVNASSSLSPPRLGRIRRLFVIYWPPNRSARVWLWRFFYYWAFVAVFAAWLYISVLALLAQLLVFQAEDVAGFPELLNYPDFGEVWRALCHPLVILLFSWCLLTRLSVFFAEHDAAKRAKKLPIAVENLTLFLKGGRKRNWRKPPPRISERLEQWAQKIKRLSS